MSLSIRKNLFKSNALILLLGTTSITALLGTITYHLVGWPRSIVFSIAIFLAAITITILLLDEHSTKMEPSHKRGRAFLFFNIILFFSVISLFLYGATHPAHGWTGSPWQTTSAKYLIGLIAIIVLTAYGVIEKKISARILFGVFLLLLSVNVIIFPQGFGFDVFVHDATIRAWLSHGIITPITPLYNGFHALVAAIASITHLRALTIISWIVPIMGALILTAIQIVTRTTREDFHKVPYIFLAFFIGFNSLFTTSTPQALGHFMLFGLVSELWMCTPHNKPLRWLLRILVALGIAAIHPLSGIPAVAAVVWMMLDLLPNKKLKKIFYILFGALTILLPTIILMVGTHGTLRASSLSSIALTELFFSITNSFQPFIITRIAYALALLGPLALYVCALFGYAVQDPDERHERRLFILSLLMIIAGIITRAVFIENVIGYEQSAFATRILIAAYILAIPLAASGFTHMWTRSHTRVERYIIATACIACIGATWYAAFPAWNTVARTRAINTSSVDFDIVAAINRDAAGKKYVVLADQPTSAAALYTFGFFDQQLPDRDFYFYPIPTGADLYTKYFLPAMYDGVTTELLTNAAMFANVKDTYIVIKPYWTNAEKNTAALQQNTTNVLNVDGVMIGHLQLK